MATRRSRTSFLSLGVRILALGSGCVLTACPPTDDYFIRPTGDAGGSGGSGGAVGGDSSVSGSGGSGGSSAGTSAGTGAVAGDATSAGGGDAGGFAGEGAGSANVGGDGVGGDGIGGKSGKGCSVECNAGRVCDAQCHPGWVATSPPPGGFSPRERAAYVSLGNQLFIWGGLNESGTPLNSGALYDPRTDSWHMISSDGSPSPRSDATAVWTGSVVVVFGGMDPSGPTAYDDGALYDPVDDTWQPMESADTARVAPVGAQTSNGVLFWGGTDAAGDELDGIEFYDPDSDWWDWADGDSQPDPRRDAAFGAGNLTFWIFGGRGDSDGASDATNYYSIGSDAWNPQSNDVLSARWGGFGAFINASFHTWGGRDLDTVFDDGMYYDGWGFGDMVSDGRPTARYASYRESGWPLAVDDHMFVVLAGLSGPGNYLTDGGIFDTEQVAWTKIPAWPGGASHAWGAVDWAAGEIVVWGGRDGGYITNSGVRYLPPPPP